MMSQAIFFYGWYAIFIFYFLTTIIHILYSFYTYLSATQIENNFHKHCSKHRRNKIIMYSNQY